MPAPMIKSFAEKTDKSEAEVEKLWKKTEQIFKDAKDIPADSEYAYRTGILKKMLGLAEQWQPDTIEDYLTEMTPIRLSGVSGKNSDVEQNLTLFMADFNRASDGYLRGLGYMFMNDVAVEISPFDGAIHLSSIYTFEDVRHFGKATKVMNGITDLADKHKVKMTLTPKPFGNSTDKPNEQQLVKWYRKFGFTGTTKRMVREPKGK